VVSRPINAGGKILDTGGAAHLVDQTLAAETKT
jgi:hypothetical protein